MSKLITSDRRVVDRKVRLYVLPLTGRQEARTFSSESVKVWDDPGLPGPGSELLF